MIREKILMQQWKRLYILTIVVHIVYTNNYLVKAHVWSCCISSLIILQLCCFTMTAWLLSGISLSGQRLQSISVSGNKQNGKFWYFVWFGYFILYNFCYNWNLNHIFIEKWIFKILRKKKIQFFVFLFLFSFALQVVRKKVFAPRCCSCIWLYFYMGWRPWSWTF